MKVIHTLPPARYAVFARRCPQCGTPTENVETFNTGYGVIYKRVCKKCDVMYIWDTRLAWERKHM